MLTLSLIVATCLSSAAFGAQDREIPPEETQLGMTTGACERARESEAQMDDLLARLKEALSQDQRALEMLVRSQDAWKGFKESHLGFLLHDAEEVGAWGSVLSMCACTFLQQLIDDRVRQLRFAWEPLKGDVCAPHLPRAPG